MNVAALRQSRTAKVEALKAIQTRAANENRDLTAAESAEWSAGETEVRNLDTQIQRAEFLTEAERRAEAEPITGRGDVRELERRFQIGKALAEFSEGGRLTGAEAEWAAEHRSGRSGAFAAPVSVFLGETRAQTVGTDTAGGHLVSTQLGAMIDRNRPKLAVETMGATVLSGLTSFLDLPRMTSSGAASWVAEQGEATRSSAAFDKVSMGPKTVAAEYEISRRMLIQGSAIEALLRQDLGFLLAQALDGAAIKGGGSNEPTGILATAGVTTVPIGTNGGALIADLIPDLIGALEAVDASGVPGFLTNSKVKKAAMKLKDGQGNYLGLDKFWQGELATYSNQVPSNLTKGTGTALSAILYGVWSDLIIGYWSSVDIVINPYHSDVASKGGALLHAFLDADIALRHPDSFAVCKDLVAA